MSWPYQEGCGGLAWCFRPAISWMSQHDTHVESPSGAAREDICQQYAWSLRGQDLQCSMLSNLGWRDARPIATQCLCQQEEGKVRRFTPTRLLNAAALFLSIRNGFCGPKFVPRKRAGSPQKRAWAHFLGPKQGPRNAQVHRANRVGKLML